jgi:DNA mismatch repair ATPase MutS
VGGALSNGTPASRGIGHLRRLVGLLDAQRNQFFAPIAFLTMWGLHFSLSIERWRERWGPAISSWLDAVGELEALCSLAGYAYERPADPFPAFTDGGPAYVGEALGHPLLAEGACVRNSIALGRDPSVWVVSGSNMSGKSTFLRVVGINAVLAMAGAPVRARSLTLSPLCLGATIRIQDSLQEGSSRFYAEIQRLKQLMELAGSERPLLFLLDEILHGTNSHDRQIGADAVVRSLIGSGAIGLVTTHDLALTKTADDLGTRAANVHFEDRLESGRLVFDYELKQGVVQKSNALDLMRSVGLEV